MMVKSSDELRRLVKQIFLSSGAGEANAAEVAAHLVQANLSGVDSHGVWHVLGYVQRIKKGELDPAAQPEVLNESTMSVLVTGHWTFGQVGARFALEKTIEKAKSHNMAVGGLVQSNHIGRLGHYAELAAAEGMISMICLGGLGVQNPAAMPYGGRQKLLHTNPVAMGFPGGDGEPALMFDFATTALAGVKVINASNRGQALPPGCVVDKDGNPTGDPNALLEGGGHLPFGGHKGYAIMMTVEYLGRVLLGSDAYAEEGRGWLNDRYAGTFMMVFKADLFQPFADYAHSAAGLARQTRGTAPAPGFDQVLMPGDLEVRARTKRRRDGIPIEDDVWQTLIEAAELVGIKDIEA